MITKDDIAKEYTYDVDKGQLIKIGGRKRKELELRTAPYSNVNVGGITLKKTQSY